MYMRSPLPSLSEDSNQKLSNLRRNLLHDVLKYNQQQYNNRRNQARLNHSMQQQQIHQRMIKQQQFLRRQNQQKRLNIIQKRRILRDEYERQIKQKRERLNKQRQYDSVYAKIQRQYADYSNDRRIRDIERMFNRKTYQASINDDGSKYKNHASYNHLSERSRLNTQPLHNPESQNQRHHSQHRYNQGAASSNYQINQNIASSNNLRYKDSLDKLEVPDQNRQTPSRYNNNSISSNINVSINPTPQNNNNNNSNNLNTKKNTQVENKDKPVGNNAIFRPPAGNGNFRMNYN